MSRTGLMSFVCAECGKSFGRRPDLNRHAGIHDPDAERFYCAYPGCNHSSLQKSNLKSHYISKHLLQRQHKCNLEGCTKSYDDVSALIRHEKRQHHLLHHHHKGQKPYPSPDERSSRKKSIMEAEMATPSPVPDFLVAPSLSFSGSTSSSPSPSESSSTSFVPFFTLNPDLYTPQASTVQSGDRDAFLHGLVPDVFPETRMTQYVAPGFGLDTDFFRMEDSDFLKAIAQFNGAASSVPAPSLHF